MESVCLKKLARAKKVKFPYDFRPNKYYFLCNLCNPIAGVRILPRQTPQNRR